MIQFWILLMVAGSTPIQTIPIDLGIEEVVIDRSEAVQAGPHGLVLNTGTSLYHFDLDGRLIHRYGGPELAIGWCSTFLVGPDFFWLVDIVKKKSMLFDHQGQLRFQGPALSIRHIQQLDRRTFAVCPSFIPWNDQSHEPMSRKLDMNREPFPSLIELIDMEFNEDRFVHRRLGKSFFRATRTQRDLRLDYKLWWVFQRNGEYLVLNYVDPKVFRYSTQTLYAERRHSLAEEFSRPAIALPLPGFVACPGPFPAKPVYFAKEHYSEHLFKWKRTWSFIQGAAETKDGYVVAYSVPLPNDDQNVGFSMVSLDENFGYRETLLTLETNAILMGVVDGTRAYIFIPRYRYENTRPKAMDAEIRIYDLS